MTIQVFVSHTQKDVEFCDVFDRACARVGIKAFRSEFETLKFPAWQTIRDAIRKSKALFLLIGKELVNYQNSYDSSWSYTQNWIAYEIGVACDRGIDVWVICDDVRINFPVPYLSHYVTVSPRHREAFDFLVENLDEYVKGARTVIFDENTEIQCIHDNCKAVYYFPVRMKTGDRIICPQCLRELEFYKNHLMD